MAQPVADFRVDVASGCLPLKVTFEALSPQAVSWEWNLGVSTTNSQNPTLVYLDPGQYSIQLIVTDALGRKDTLEKQDFIRAYAPPKAIANVSQLESCKGDILRFLDESLSGTGEIISWEWNFGDGFNSFEQNPSHIYVSNGKYPVSLYVEDEYGCSSEEPLGQSVTINAPNAEFQVDNPGACTPPLIVRFNSSNQNGEQHTWDFGDGAISEQPTPFHSYSFIGSYSVTHTVIDAQGCKDSVHQSKLINIGGGGFLQITSTDTAICLGNSAQFATTAAANSSISWDFGDGATSTALLPVHSYAALGTYAVSVNVIDAGGCSGFARQTVRVYDYPEVDFTVSGPTKSCEVPFTVDFVDQSSDVLSWYWIFGDGQTSTEQNPTNIYVKEDSFRVILAGTGPGGCLRTAIKDKYIITKENTGDFYADVTSGCVPLDVQFGDNLITLSSITDWEWDFGDGNTSTERSPSHSYTSPGVYTVQLILTNIEGCKDTLRKVNFIQSGTKPVLDVGLAQDTVCAWEPVQFTNLSTTGNFFFWDFGDGENGVGTHPIHPFRELGYMDLFMVGSYNGCQDTLVREDYIYVLGPLPQIKVDQTAYCEIPAMVNLEGSSLGSPFFTWDFGNGNTGTGAEVTTYFAEEGTFTVTLTSESDSTGCKVSAEEVIQVYGIEAEIAVDTRVGCVPFDVQFADSSKNRMQSVWVIGTDTLIETSPLIQYDKSGGHDVVLISTNQLGCSDTLVQPDFIQAHELQAAFSNPDSLIGCIPFTAHFQDSSFGTSPVSRWRWYFGDSTYSFDQDPIHTFTLDSTFSIRLEVEDVNGCKDTLQKNKLLHLTEPKAYFETNYPENCPSNPISFFNLSEGEGLRYNWDLGDGMTTTDINPIHSYPQEGFYTISLSVTDQNGCQHSLTRENYIHIAALPDDFSPDSTTVECPPLIANFTPNKALYLGQADVVWDFGDGSTSNDYFTSARFTQAGIFDISLSIISPSGCTVFLEKEKLIEVGGPEGGFQFFPDTVCPGEAIHFEANAKVEVSYEWIFGDGTTVTGDTLAHAFASPGTYRPVLVITDSIACSSFIPAPKDLVVLVPPEPSVAADEVLHCDSGTTQFTASIVKGSPAQAWQWDIGSGFQPGFSTHTVHFPDTGFYNIAVAAVDDKGCRDTLYLPHFITVAASPSPTIQAPDTAGCVPFSLVFSSMPLGSPLGPIWEWHWDFGDGDSSPLAVPVHTFFQEGLYTVSLAVTDTNGCKGSVEHHIRAWPLPNPGFTVLADSFTCAPVHMGFTSFSPTAVSWKWDFGDGNSSVDQHPQHLYDQDGIYTVDLEIQDANGCVNSVSKHEYIHLARPEINFSHSHERTCLDTLVHFQGTANSDTTILLYEWDFGEGTTDIGQTPTHPYSQSGLFDVRLIVEDALGCRDTLVKNQAIEILDRIVPEHIDIRSVSVLSDTEIEIRYFPFPNTRNDFGRYVLYRSEDGIHFNALAQNLAVEETIFIDTDLDARNGNYCYKVVVESMCGVQGPLALANTHCPVQLSAFPLQDAIELSWTAYKGWPTIQSYEVFRVLDYRSNTLEWRASLPASQTQWIDTSTFCYDSLKYRIIAAADFAPLKSYSNLAAEAPIHFGPDKALEMVRVSIENDVSVLLEWDREGVQGLDSVYIERKGDDGNQVVFKTSGQDAKFQDTSVSVYTQSYRYRLTAKDSCGDLAPLGRPHRTMLLKTQQENGAIRVEWTPYEGWENGVSSYSVEMYDMNTDAFSLLGVVPGDVYSFEDDFSNVPQLANCYRVTAHERQGEGSASFSNQNCRALNPVLYSANAFSPNGDGMNDVFHIKGVFVDDFELSVYNRWGRRVFRSQNLTEGWNGMHSHTGKVVPPGIYLYVAKGKGFDGQALVRSGSITIVQ